MVLPPQRSALVVATARQLKFRPSDADCLDMRQFASSAFDALIAVTIVVGIPASAIQATPVVLAVTGTAILLACWRFSVERRAG